MHQISLGNYANSRSYSQVKSVPVFSDPPDIGPTQWKFWLIERTHSHEKGLLDQALLPVWIGLEPPPPPVYVRRILPPVPFDQWEYAFLSAWVGLISDAPAYRQWLPYKRVNGEKWRRTRHFNPPNKSRNTLNSTLWRRSVGINWAPRWVIMPYVSPCEIIIRPIAYYVWRPTKNMWGPVLWWRPPYERFLRH